MTLKLTSAGESHGPGLVAIVTGLPAGLVLDRDQPGAVRLARTRELQGHGSKPRALRMAATGASRPVQYANEAAPCLTSASSPSTTSRQPASRATATRAVGRPSAR